MSILTVLFITTLYVVFWAFDLQKKLTPKQKREYWRPLIALAAIYSIGIFFPKLLIGVVEIIFLAVAAFFVCLALLLLYLWEKKTEPKPAPIPPKPPLI